MYIKDYQILEYLLKIHSAELGFSHKCSKKHATYIESYLPVNKNKMSQQNLETYALIIEINQRRNFIRYDNRTWKK